MFEKVAWISTVFEIGSRGVNVFALGVQPSWMGSKKEICARVSLSNYSDMRFCPPPTFDLS
jgi:hypothetical protein